MSDYEHSSAQKEARRTTPRRPWTPQEEPRQDALRRYLTAVAAAASARSTEGPETAPGSEKTRPPATAAHEPPAGEPAILRVRDVMQVPAASVPGDMPFLDVAHTLGREQVSALPVVDADDHVIGVVSESDLLAKAAVMAEPHRHGPVGKLRQHHLYEKSRGDTAATLMTFPPVTVHPAQRVADAAWTAAHARLKRLPVTDHHGRLVGVVSRRDLLRALIRDDAEIRAEVESLIGRHWLDPRAVGVAVENGVVTMTGRVDKAVAPELLASVRDIDDVIEVVDDMEAF
ncbi:CBS domain-containing protein [Streptomyces ipomoeae]|uniref:CBS domain protein n=1 Tax=Streptomyces ipomoeae 91-03 TaxID=698759 RepID=L1KTC2_9ACTN|nr:CBS domain-containing protein [Streptomyces ipomoeae]EKX64066.1 CBS domain protein [Streptomyces ipomoeae 91-03]MDX2692084.1 CBS domain-containing protein [Streptomyces ipomoeae]MDX2837459.1 CBS domain-containing protein [Streptomyces ipomoeae]TQE21309.1 CBS domain-containing protein [Streptomyces ipomoeae]